MQALKVLFTTDYGLLSLIVLAFIVFGMGGFFMYLFIFKSNSANSQTFPKSPGHSTD